MNDRLRSEKRPKSKRKTKKKKMNPVEKKWANGKIMKNEARQSKVKIEQTQNENMK